MSRLTTKIEDGFYVADHAHNTDEVTHKLGKLEDLEDELGFDLTKLQEISEIYVIDYDNELKKYKIIGANFKEKQIYFWDGFCPMYLSLSEYKKIFWLKEDKSE